MIYLLIIIWFQMFNEFLVAIISSDAHALFESWYYHVFPVPAEAHDNTVHHHSLCSFFPFVRCVSMSILSVHLSKTIYTILLVLYMIYWHILDIQMTLSHPAKIDRFSLILLRNCVDCPLCCITLICLSYSSRNCKVTPRLAGLRSLERLSRIL